VNRFGDELKSGQDADKLKESLGKLTEAARAHVVHEEWLIANALPTDVAERYKSEQRALIDDLESQSAQIGAKSMALTLRYLMSWLSRHIEGNRLYAKRLLERGLGA
jgi:hemerythrin